MTAFLKIDLCKTCSRAIPWEWIPAVMLNGKSMAGTGVWRTQLTENRCPSCQAGMEAKRQEEKRRLQQRSTLIRLMGGEKPYREFTFEKYAVETESRLAFEQAKRFDPATDNLYLWGPCGVGKTHLAWAVARMCFEQNLSVTIMLAGQLSRRVRMKDPEQEQNAVDDFVKTDLLVLDDLGAGDSPFGRQILQEIIDGRIFKDRAGLVVTSSFSLGGLASRFACDSIPSRLAGLCQVIRIGGRDHRTGPPQYNGRV